MSRRVLSITALLLAAPAFGAGLSGSGKAVWALEDSYWHYVQSNDLEHYRMLWHRDFLGWPLSSPEPVRKEHITDWIAAHTSAGETLKSYELERIADQHNGDYVTVAYRIRMAWTGRDGAPRPGALRVIHTWLREPGGRWQIISGMAASVDAQGH